MALVTAWNSGGEKTQVKGEHNRGVKSFEVVNSSSFVGRKYLVITASGLYQINGICSARSPCLAMLTLSENFESS